MKFKIIGGIILRYEDTLQTLTSENVNKSLLYNSRVSTFTLSGKRPSSNLENILLLNFIRNDLNHLWTTTIIYMETMIELKSKIINRDHNQQNKLTVTYSVIRIDYSYLKFVLVTFSRKIIKALRLKRTVQEIELHQEFF